MALSCRNASRCVRSCESDKTGVTVRWPYACGMHFDNTVSDSTRLSRTLVFWDIDYTLVGIGGDISKAIYASAFRKVTGRQMHVLADLAGRTEQAIIIETLYRNGVEQYCDSRWNFHASATISVMSVFSGVQPSSCCANTDEA